MPARQRTAAWRRRVTRERHRLQHNPTLAVCWLCGDPIDMNLPTDHPHSFSLDHIVPIGRGGQELGESKPAHRDCNASRSDGRTTKNEHETLLEW